jgi:hypothetical protein
MFVETQSRTYGSGEPELVYMMGLETGREVSLALGAVGIAQERLCREDGSFHRVPMNERRIHPQAYTSEQIDTFQSTLLAQRGEQMRFSLEDNTFETPMLSIQASNLLRDLVLSVSDHRPIYLRADDENLPLSQIGTYEGAVDLYDEIAKGKNLGKRTVEKMLKRRLGKRIHLPKGVIGYQRVEAGIGSHYPKLASVTVATSLLDK